MILVTGANGFIGKNLILELQNRGWNDLCLYTRESSEKQLQEYCASCRFVFHLAGINRPQREEEFWQGNLGLLKRIVETMESHQNYAPILLTSSTQAVLENSYGKSKRAAEEYLIEEGKRTGRKVLVYRLGNLFGKWSKPNYNSVVATFCHNIAHGLPIRIDNPETVLRLTYIDDVVNELIRAMEDKSEPGEDGFYYVGVPFQTTLGELAATIRSFRDSREKRFVPDMGKAFIRDLYATYLSYLPKDEFSYPLKMNVDERGSFTEFLRTADRGQVSVNVAKPGVIKGNHWHHTKNEKFLVVKGQGVIRFRKLGEEEVIEYPVSGDEMRVVDIPTGYTHSITNTGNEDLITIMWASESFDPQRPDTYFQEV